MFTSNLPFSPFDSYTKHSVICKKMNWLDADYSKNIISLFSNENLSCPEIAEIINKDLDPLLHITPRSIQRVIKKAGLSRTPSESFHLAIKKGRMRWNTKKTQE